MELDKVKQAIEAFAALGGDAKRLTEQKRWVCWQRQPKKNGGGFSKPPIDPRTGRRMDIRTPEGREALFTAGEALAALEAGKCDGIGIATGVFDGLPLVGMDIDNCLGDELAIVEKYRGDLEIMGKAGYFEISPSGKGVRGFALCEKPAGYRTRSGGVEVYADGQYCTLTGVRIKGADKPLNADDTAVVHLCEKYLKPQEAVQASPQEETGLHSRIDTAMQHDGTFASLWNGNRPNGDESGDDLALMNKLAYWLDKNEAAMIEAFKNSPHAASKDADHAKKLARKDYLPNTARKAAQECRDTASDADARHKAERMDKAREILKETAKEAPQPRETKKETSPSLVKVSDVPYEQPKWLIAPYFQRGKGTLVQADNGAGKTAFICAVAAHVSTGSPLLDIQVDAPGCVLILSVEDDLPVLRGRIEANGGDLDKCYFVTNAAGLTFNSPEVEAAVKDISAKMVIFDPFQAFLGARVDMHRSNETRPELAKLMEMAERNDCSIVILAHMSKGGIGGAAVNRALGSVDIPAAMRSIIQIGRNPENENECIAVHIKCSNAPKGRSLSYTIGNYGGIAWNGYSHLTVDDLEAAKKRQERGIDYDQEPLVQLFRKLITDKPVGGFWPYAEVKEIGMKELGFPPFSDTYDLKNRLSGPLTRELQQRDHLIVTCEHKQNGLRGIRIEPYSARQGFQTVFGGGA